MKKIISFVLACCLVWGATLFPAGIRVRASEREDALPFTDVADDAWFRDAVEDVWEEGLFSGTSETRFSPDSGMTRGMFVTVLGKKSGIAPEEFMRYRFTDTKLGEYYAPYVEWAASYGIVSGTSKMSFQPNAQITREQMATILYQYAKKTGNDTSFTEEGWNAFSDCEAVSDYAQISMKWAVSHGVLAGFDGKLNPKGTATRAQVAQVFYNCKEVLAKTAVNGTPVLAEEPDFTPVSLDQLQNFASLSRGMTREQFVQAYNYAVEIVRPLNGYTDELQLMGITSQLRMLFDQGIEYSTTAAHYDDVYGYFIDKKASCAGCTRATGLCLNILGYSYEHVNENEWSHQWCRVRLGNEYWICDPYGLYCGVEPAPYRHPYLW